MPITNTYRRYTCDGAVGLIANDSVPIKYTGDSNGKTGITCITGTGSSIALWNLRKSQPVDVFLRESGTRPVTALAICSDPSSADTLAAVGYMDGWVSLFSLWSQKEEAKFRAGVHRVTSLDLSSLIIACAAESELHIMDIVSGGGFRLKGHRGAITTVKLHSQQNILVSGGRDSFIKFWCLQTQHCFLTLTGHPGPVWGFAFSPDRNILVSGSSDALLRLWKIRYNRNTNEKTESDFLNSECHRKMDKSGLSQSLSLSDYSSLVQIDFRGTIARKSTKRVFSLSFDPSGRYLACQTLDKVLEIYALLSESERNSRLKKKQKKARASGITEPISELAAGDELRCIFRVTLPTKLSSCDLRMSRLNARRPPTARIGVTEERNTFTLLHLLCSYRNNLVEEYSIKVPEAVPVRPIHLNAARVEQFHWSDVKEGATTQESLGLRLVNRIANLGHRAYPTDCQVTEDGLGIFTLSREEGKLWNRANLACLATIEWNSIDKSRSANAYLKENEDNELNFAPVASEKLKASAFVLAPSSRHVVVGFESGAVSLFDLMSKRATQTIADAHSCPVKSLILTGDRKGVISGGADSKVGFWNFDLELLPGSSPRLCLKEGREAQSVADQITTLAATPDNRLIAVAMVNLHVDIFFTDSFKRVHSLYGMAAPVTCMDVSDDSRLLMTGSGDKTLRLWELQFGNCLRRFAEHTEPITSVRFLHSSTLAFSADLGGTIREWDVKRLHQVCTFKGHEGGITGLSTIATRPGLGKQSASSKHLDRRHRLPKRGRHDGDDENAENDDDNDDGFEADVCGGLLVSTGRDFACRVWRESEELLVLEEEAELEREAAEDEEELARAETLVPGAVTPEASETGPLGRPSVTTRNAADALMEAIDIYSQQTASKNDGLGVGIETPQHPLMVAYGAANDPERFLFIVFTGLRLPISGGGGLEHTLGSVHADHARRLLPRLVAWMERGWDVELCGRALRYLCTLHAGMVTADPTLSDVLSVAQTARQAYLSKTRKIVGMNLAALGFLQQKIEEENPIALFDEATAQRTKRAKKIKERLATKRAAIAVH